MHVFEKDHAGFSNTTQYPSFKQMPQPILTDDNWGVQQVVNFWKEVTLALQCRIFPQVAILVQSSLSLKTKEDNFNPGNEIDQELLMKKQKA